MRTSSVLGTPLGIMDIVPQVTAFMEAEQKLCSSGSNNYDKWKAESGQEKETLK